MKVEQSQIEAWKKQYPYVYVVTLYDGDGKEITLYLHHPNHAQFAYILSLKDQFQRLAAGEFFLENCLLSDPSVLQDEQVKSAAAIRVVDQIRVYKGNVTVL